MKCLSSGSMYLPPPHLAQSKNSDFQLLSAKFRSKFLGWESNMFLTYGRACLIKSGSNVMANFCLRFASEFPKQPQNHGCYAKEILVGA